jgi:hypothetical protein
MQRHSLWSPEYYAIARLIYAVKRQLSPARRAGLVRGAGDASSLCILHLDVDGRIGVCARQLLAHRPLRHSSQPCADNDERNDLPPRKQFPYCGHPPPPAIVFNPETVRKQRDRAPVMGTVNDKPETPKAKTPHSRLPTKCSIA